MARTRLAIGLIVASTALGCGLLATLEDHAASYDGGADATSDAVLETGADAGDAGDSADPFSVDEQYVDGTRLKASFYVTAAGARQFRGWFDTGLGTFCSFARHDDGKLRCLPRARPDNFFFSATGCGDAGATDAGVPVVYVPECEETPLFVDRPTPFSNPYCEATHAVHRVGARVGGATFYEQLGPQEACIGPVAVVGNDRLHARGEELAGAAFVEGTEAEWSPPGNTTASNAVAIFVHAVDGARGLLRLRETNRGQTCELRVPSAIDPTVRCVPVRTLLNNDFSEGTCTSPAFPFEPSGPTCAVPPFGIVFESSADNCGSTEDFYLVAASPLIGPGFRRSSPSSCDPIDGGYHAGTRFGLPNFAAAEPVAVKAGVRLNRVQHALPNGTRVQSGLPESGLWRDVARSEDCQFQTAADGKVRCVPSVQGYASFKLYYADAACTQKLVVAEPSVCVKPVKLLATATVSAGEAGACAGPSLTHVFAAGAVVSTTIYLGNPQGTVCTPRSPDPNRPMYRFGAEISPTEFVEGTPTVP